MQLYHRHRVQLEPMLRLIDKRFPFSGIVDDGPEPFKGSRKVQLEWAIKRLEWFKGRTTSFKKLNSIVRRSQQARFAFMDLVDALRLSHRIKTLEEADQFAYEVIAARCK